MNREREKTNNQYDEAQYLAQVYVEDAVAHAKRAAEIEYQRLGPPDGSCLWCRREQPIDNWLQRFCDGDCRADWERAQAAAQRNGKSE